MNCEHFFSVRDRSHILLHKNFFLFSQNFVIIYFSMPESFAGFTGFRGIRQRLEQARTLAHYSRKKEPGKLPDSFKIHLLKTVVKLQRLMAGSCDNVILLLLGQADELNSITGYTDGEVSVLRLLRMSLCV